MKESEIMDEIKSNRRRIRELNAKVVDLKEEFRRHRNRK